MGREDKIVGMYRAEEDALLAQPAEGSENTSFVGIDYGDSDAREDLDDDFERPENGPAISLHRVISGLLIALTLAWTGFFMWSLPATFVSQFNLMALSGLISHWAAPVILLGIIWVLLLRNSQAEAGRFAQAASSLRSESLALEERLRNVNAELSIARTFLSEQTLALESLGRQSSERLSEHARTIEAAFTQSEIKAQVLNEVSNAATNNLEQLRKQLPVITGAAKDITNQIANAGRSAQGQLAHLLKALRDAQQAGGALRQQLAEFGDETSNRMALLGDEQKQLIRDLSGQYSVAEQRSQQVAQSFHGAAQHLSETVEKNQHALSSAMERTSGIFSQQMAALGSSLANFSDASEEEQHKIHALLAKIDEHRDHSQQAVQQLEQDSDAMAQQLLAQLHQTRQECEAMLATLRDNDAHANQLSDKLVHLNSTAGQQEHYLGEALPQALQKLNTQLSGLVEVAANQAIVIERMEQNGDRLAQHIGDVESGLGSQAALLDEMLAHGEQGLLAQKQQVDALATALQIARENASSAAIETRTSLAAAVDQVDEASAQAATAARRRLDDVVSGVIGELSQLSQETLDTVMRDRIEAATGTLNAAISNAMTSSTETTRLLEGRISRLNEMTANLEARIGEAKQEFEGVGEDGFARRMALLTESLNSASIDIAKILSNDVTDTAWAAYLKGDRGIFTRRAVRLLGNAEVRMIAEHYDIDGEFRNQVNRYIHDFESMMRNLLSTRDGHAIGVTLLSSDVGKLYVALAQAIERLRN